MKIIDLFSGIAGFSLAGHWAGFETALFCEMDKTCQRVIKHHFPRVPVYGNVKTLLKKIDVKEYINNAEQLILTGGFPCQPFSTAGKQQGTKDNRHLWPAMFAIIKRIKPKWVIAENVRGLLTIENGMAFEQVCLDLESEGYKVQPFIIPACAKNAPHRRDRVWIVAYNTNAGIESLQQRENGIYKSGITPDSNSDGHKLRGHPKGRPTQKKSEGAKDKRERVRGIINGISEQGFIAHSESIRRQHARSTRERRTGLENNNNQATPDSISNRQQKPGEPVKSISHKKDEKWEATWATVNGPWPTQSPVCNRNDGLSSRLVDITFSKWRRETIKMLGNSIVPQIAFEIFMAIKHIESGK